MGKYDFHEPDIIRPINFYDMNCCPVCGRPSLVILDHEFDITSINKDGYIGEVLDATITTEIGCTDCGYRTDRFCLDSEGRIKLCTEAEYIYEEDLKRNRIAKRAAEVAKSFVELRSTTVGLKSEDENPFGNWEVTHF